MGEAANLKLLNKSTMAAFRPVTLVVVTVLLMMSLTSAVYRTIGETLARETRKPNGKSCTMTRDCPKGSRCRNVWRGNGSIFGIHTLGRCVDVAKYGYRG